MKIICIAIILFLLGLDTRAQNLFVGDNVFNGNIYEISPNGSRTLFASENINCGGLAFDNAGDLFVGNGYNGTITEIAPNGNQNTFASGLSYAFGLAFDNAGDLFEADLGSGNINEFVNDNGRLSPNPVVFASGLNRPVNLAFDSSGDLFVADEGEIGGNVTEISPNGTEQIIASFGVAYGLAFDNAGDLYITDEIGGVIYKRTPSGQLTTFASGLTDPAELAFNNAGDLFEIDDGDNTINEFVNNNGILSSNPTLFASGLTYPGGLVFQVPEPSTLGIIAFGTLFIVKKCRRNMNSCRR